MSSLLDSPELPMQGTSPNHATCSSRRLPGQALATTEGWAAARPPSTPVAFLRSVQSTVAVESALSIAILVALFGSLMAIAYAAYMDDRMGRAARAAARALAFVTDPSANQGALNVVACDAIKGELHLAAGFDCFGTWFISVETDLTPTALANGSNTSGEIGDMILVEIGWQQAPWAGAVYQLRGSGARSAVGVARREPTS